MNEFVATYPGVIIGLLSLMVTIIAALLGALLWSFRKAIDDLAKSLSEAIKEMRTDRKTDRAQVGRLLDRMQKLETICDNNRRLCPALLPLTNAKKQSQ
ncbi:MAG: hypothetical protein WBB19_10890 [Desulforhopalus sp.]